MSKTFNMMRSLAISMTLFIVLPAISICDDEDSRKLSSNTPSASESSDGLATAHPIYDIPTDYNDGDVSEFPNEMLEPWWFHRQLRAPSGFLGVRGKKDYNSQSYWGVDGDDELFSLNPKRAPNSGFFGVRGKKFYGEKRMPSGFLGVRGKKDDSEYDDDLQGELYRELIQEREKIANLVRDYEEERMKRVPSGFVGLRGKKSVNNDDYYEAEKRTPMGFQGVRGKKSEYPNFIRSDEKRVPLSGFFGTRGKKPFTYESNLFGVRKKPYMPYGKFVGVRGKKDNIRKLHTDASDLQSSNGLLRPAPRVPSDTTQDKRFGFIGMRG